MNLIAIETSTRMISVALLADAQLVERKQFCAENAARYLLPWLREIIAAKKISLSSIDAIAYGSGPGAFTGLRLSAAIAQGIAVGLGRPLIGVSSLKAIAFASGYRKALVCLDARMHGVYWGVYEIQNGNVTEIVAPQISSPNQVQYFSEETFCGCGNGFAVYGAELSKQLPQLEDWDADIAPGATAVAMLALQQLQQPSFMASDEVSLLYLRDKIALTIEERKKKFSALDA